MPWYKASRESTNVLTANILCPGASRTTIKRRNTGIVNPRTTPCYFIKDISDPIRTDLNVDSPRYPRYSQTNGLYLASLNSQRLNAKFKGISIPTQSFYTQTPESQCHIQGYPHIKTESIPDPLTPKRPPGPQCSTTPYSNALPYTRTPVRHFPRTPELQFHRTPVTSVRHSSRTPSSLYASTSYAKTPARQNSRTPGTSVRPASPYAPYAISHQTSTPVLRTPELPCANIPHTPVPNLRQNSRNPNIHVHPERPYASTPAPQFPTLNADQYPITPQYRHPGGTHPPSPPPRTLLSFGKTTAGLDCVGKANR